MSAPGAVVADFEVFTAMQKYGGSFVQALAVAFFRADEPNLHRLKAAFPELWTEYHALAQRTKGEWRPWHK